MDESVAYDIMSKYFPVSITMPNRDSITTTTGIMILRRDGTYNPIPSS